MKRISVEAFNWRGAKETHIPDSVEELCGKCFYRRENLSLVTFRKASLLKWIGNETCPDSGVEEIPISDNIKGPVRNAFPSKARLMKRA